MDANMRLYVRQQEVEQSKDYPSLRRTLGLPTMEITTPKKRRVEEPEDDNDDDAHSNKISTSDGVRFDYSKELKCGICLDVVKLPACTCTNEHLFCKCCIDSNKKPECPICRIPMPVGAYPPAPRLVQTLLSLIPTRCVHDGCPETNIPKVHLQSHIDSCGYKEVVCGYAETFGCQWKGRRILQKNHQQTCPYQALERFSKPLDGKLVSLEKRLEGMNEKLAFLQAIGTKATPPGVRDTILQNALTSKTWTWKNVEIDREMTFDWCGCKFSLGTELTTAQLPEVYLKLVQSKQKEEIPLWVKTRLGAKGTETLSVAILRPPTVPPTLKPNNNGNGMRAFLASESLSAIVRHTSPTCAVRCQVALPAECNTLPLCIRALEEKGISITLYTLVPKQ